MSAPEIPERIEQEQPHQHPRADGQKTLRHRPAPDDAPRPHSHPHDPTKAPPNTDAATPTLETGDRECFHLHAQGKGNNNGRLRCGEGTPVGGKVARRLSDYLRVRRTPHQRVKAFFLSQFALVSLPAPKFTA